MNRKAVAGWASFVIAVGIGAFAFGNAGCSSKQGSNFDNGDDDGDGDGDGGEGFGKDGGLAKGDGGVGSDIGCSGDLQSVVSKSTGAVISTCPPDQGCAAGKC